MKIHCPVCHRECDVEHGKYICTDCKSKFEYTTKGLVRLIKRNKFDYLTFFYSIIIPLLFLILFTYSKMYDKSFDFSYSFVGLILIIAPFLAIFKRILFRDNDAFVIFYLYDKFFKKELNKEDAGRIVSFYLIFLQNILGLIFLVIGFIK